MGNCNVPAPNRAFVAVAGGWHSLGLKADGSIVAWGSNEFGQCNIPAPNSGFVGVGAGGFHSLGLKASRATVFDCNSPTPDGHYTAGQPADGIRITVEFSEPVIVDTAGGTPTLRLETGPTDRDAVYVGLDPNDPSGATLLFTYVVQPGDYSPDLDYTSASALSLNGATIKAVSGPNLDADLTLPTPGAEHSLGYNKDIWVGSRLFALCVGVGDTWLMNGGADAQAVWNALACSPAWADDNLPPVTLVPDAPDFTNKNLVRDKLSTIEAMIQPGDSFVFYFMGHGGQLAAPGDETPDSSGNTSDEYLILTEDGDRYVLYQLSDDEFAGDLFGDSKWADVQKLFLLDACRSGGFWGDHNPSDPGGDLEKLPQTALLASAPETRDSHSVVGRGIWSWALQSCLRAANVGSTDDLHMCLQQHAVAGQYEGQNLPVLSDWLPPPNSVSLFHWAPFYAKTPDSAFPGILTPCGSGDLNCDGLVNVADFSSFLACLAGPGIVTAPVGVDPVLFARADLDRDADVDLPDFALFQASFAGP